MSSIPSSQQPAELVEQPAEQTLEGTEVEDLTYALVRPSTRKLNQELLEAQVRELYARHKPAQEGARNGYTVEDSYAAARLRRGWWAQESGRPRVVCGLQQRRRGEGLGPLARACPEGILEQAADLPQVFPELCESCVHLGEPRVHIRPEVVDPAVDVVEAPVHVVKAPVVVKDTGEDREDHGHRDGSHLLPAHDPILQGQSHARSRWSSPDGHLQNHSQETGAGSPAWPARHETWS